MQGSFTGQVDSSSASCRLDGIVSRGFLLCQFSGVCVGDGLVNSVGCKMPRNPGLRRRGGGGISQEPGGSSGDLGEGTSALHFKHRSQSHRWLGQRDPAITPPSWYFINKEV